MSHRELVIAFYTLTRKEILRFFRLWPQTLLPPVITITLYLVIFGNFALARRDLFADDHYLAFLVPGLIMMTVINSAFANVVGSFYIAKFQRELEELLVSPIPIWLLISGYIAGGVTRGIIAGFLVFILSLLFWTPHFQHPLLSILFPSLAALVFSLAGLFNGIFARKFDDISLFSTFILVPLTYLGGVFYSVEMLSPTWKWLSSFNPILYIINGFRYSVHGVGGGDVVLGIAILSISAAGLAAANGYLLRKGYGIRE